MPQIVSRPAHPVWFREYPIDGYDLDNRPRDGTFVA